VFQQGNHGHRTLPPVLPPGEVVYCIDQSINQFILLYTKFIQLTKP